MSQNNVTFTENRVSAGGRRDLMVDRSCRLASHGYGHMTQIGKKGAVLRVMPVEVYQFVDPDRAFDAVDLYFEAINILERFQICILCLCIISIKVRLVIPLSLHYHNFSKIK